jgi:hypothetical protein
MAKISTERPIARVKLDEIRDLLGAEKPPRNFTCPECGGRCLSIEICRYCQGKRVLAENLLRAIRELSKL